MRTVSTVSLALMLAVGASAQNYTSLVTSLTQQLSSMGLDSLVDAINSITNTNAGQRLFSQLDNAQQTFFAPSDAAFNGEMWNISSNPELLANVLSYHILPGKFDTTQTYPNTTVGRTLLDHTSGLVFLEGNRNQALAWSNVAGTSRILNQNTEADVVGQSNFDKLTIHVVNAIIDLPGPFTWAIDANSLYSFQDALTSAGLLDTLNTMRGVTIFAPTDDAFNAVQQNLNNLNNNFAEMNAILRNHYIAGDSVYTGNLQGGERPTSAGGQQYSATFSQNGGYVTLGNVTARIVVPDIILENGVLHVIDHVFLNDQVNNNAASSFASSVSTAATASTTMTGPIGYTPSATHSNGSNSAGRIEFPLKTIGLSGLLGALGMVAGVMLAL